MDADGYPTDKTLRVIKNWPYNDFQGLMVFIRVAWWMPEFGWRSWGKKYWLSTAGWSGNEDIIRALERNMMFWLMCWQSSRRGGHYIFEIPQLTAAGRERGEGDDGKRPTRHDLGGSREAVA